MYVCMYVCMCMCVLVCSLCIFLLSPSSSSLSSSYSSFPLLLSLPTSSSSPPHPPSPHPPPPNPHRHPAFLNLKSAIFSQMPGTTIPFSPVSNIAASRQILECPFFGQVGVCVCIRGGGYRSSHPGWSAPPHSTSVQK